MSADARLLYRPLFAEGESSLRGRLLVASNRLPVVAPPHDAEPWNLETLPPGVVRALVGALAERGGSWIGRPGADGLAVSGRSDGWTLAPLAMPAAAGAEHEAGFANEAIWPLFHGFASDCRFDPCSWAAYRRLNRSFAKAIARRSSAADLVWVHDYHLMGVAAELRRLRPASRTAFFLHIPFPAPDLLAALPWRGPLLTGLLAFDQVGFQTRRDLANFLDGVRTFLPGRATMSRVPMERRRELWAVRDTPPETEPFGEHALVAGAFPMSIDVREFASGAAAPSVEARVADLERSLRGRRLVLGVDRLDYTKGIPWKLRAFAEALARDPSLCGAVSLLQVVVPSRERLPAYVAAKAEIERLVGEINGRFGSPGWVPVHYLYRSPEREELLAWYRAADVALITPLRDGMNLVAKQYCAADVAERGALVLSEFSGAAPELKNGALLVNPYDVEGTAAALRRALAMAPDERAARMARLRRQVREHDVFRWAGSFLTTAIAAGLLGGSTADEELVAN